MPSTNFLSIIPPGRRPRLTRINRYEGSCHKSRAHVSIVTRTRINRYEPPMMVAGDAHWPITTSTSPDIDIDTARQRHRYRPMRMGNDSRRRCQPSLRGMQWHGYKNRKGVAPLQNFAFCVKSWCRIFPRTISGISDTNLSATPAQGRLKRSKIKRREAIKSPIPTTSKGKECLLTALNTARRNSLPLGRVGVGL